VPRTYQDQEIVAIAQEIHDYLSAHPNAVDSLEGVVKWWLTRQRFESATDSVQKALDYLVAGGLVSKKVIASGRVVYVSAKQQEMRKH
jgi:hypothetical protein